MFGKKKGALISVRKVDEAEEVVQMTSHLQLMKKTLHSALAFVKDSGKASALDQQTAIQAYTDQKHELPPSIHLKGLVASTALHAAGNRYRQACEALSQEKLAAHVNETAVQEEQEAFIQHVHNNPIFDSRRYMILYIPSAKNHY